MLGKLFKYEWRSISKLLLPIHGFVLLFALLSRFYFTISGGTDALLNTDSTIIGTLTMLLIFALVIVISSIAIFTYIYSGYHFHKNVFTDQGYLTNTLPVGASNPLINLIKVVFPLPFGPRRPIILPDSKERVILSSACLRPYFLDRFLHSRIVLIFDSPFRVFQVK